MKLLIDGCLNYLELLLIDNNDKIIDSFFTIQNKNLTDILIISINEFLQKNNISNEMINELLVINGPGSFTSIKLVAIFANTWKQFYPSISLKQLNTCLWNSVSKYTINVLDAKSNYYYVNIYNDSTNPNSKHIVNLVLKDEFEKIYHSKKSSINYINNIINPNSKWEFNKNNFVKVDRIIPNYVKPAV